MLLKITVSEFPKNDTNYSSSSQAVGDAIPKMESISPEKLKVEVEPVSLSPAKQSRMSSPAKYSTSSPGKKLSKPKDTGKLKMENIQMGKEPELTRRRPVRQASRAKYYEELQVWVSETNVDFWRFHFFSWWIGLHRYIFHDTIHILMQLSWYDTRYNKLHNKTRRVLPCGLRSLYS